MKRCFPAVCCVLIGLAHVGTATADEQDDKKSKIERKFEVVSWGPKQSLVNNLKRVVRAISSKGGDFEVYKQRYSELKLHWDDAQEKFDEAGVDWRSEPIYVGYIEWTKYQSVLTASVPTDHYIQFYIAARKRPSIDNAELGRETARLKRRELKRTLEAANLEMLKARLESTDRETLKIGLELVDRRTLANALECIDRKTLYIALESIDTPTLKNGLQLIDRPTLKIAIEGINRETLKRALECIDDETLRVVCEVIDDETFRVALEVVNEATKEKMLAFRA